MDWTFKYSDRNGIVETTINSDGKNLTVNLRGVTFTGEDLDSLEPEKGIDCSLLESFTLHNESLCECTIECTIEVTISNCINDYNGVLDVILELGSPKSNGALDKEVLTLCLVHGDMTYRSSGLSGWFEDEMLDIQKQLTGGTYMKVCFNCLYSDYSPYGHGSYGWMMCFRNLKKEYLKVKCKDDFWGIHNNYEQLVQETYLCPEFERRIEGTGYRG